MSQYECAFPNFRTTRLLGHVQSPTSEENIRETRIWGKTRFADGIVMAKTGHEAGKMGGVRVRGSSGQT